MTAQASCDRAWIENESIAQNFSRVSTVIKGLRHLLPRYDGPAVKLYRGELRRRWRNRSMGISWTTDLQVAEKFATDVRQCFAGGSVIVEAIAEPEAILCNMDAVGDYYSEREYLVDPRRLHGLRVMRRFAQISHREHFRPRAN